MPVNDLHVKVVIVLGGLWSRSLVDLMYSPEIFRTVSSRWYEQENFPNKLQCIAVNFAELREDLYNDMYFFAEKSGKNVIMVDYEEKYQYSIWYIETGIYETSDVIKHYTMAHKK